MSFELAERALGDPFSLTVPDPYPDEERWRTLGAPSTDGVVILYVVHTWPQEELGRIISARKATASERAAYEARES